MQVIRNIDKMERVSGLSIALGFFDGVHTGHTELIKKAVSLAKEKGIKSAVYTFSSHPGNKLHLNVTQKMLTDNTEKISLIKNLGVDYLIIIPFTRILSALSPENFVKEILVQKLYAKVICVGSDYRFGANAIGCVNTLKMLAKKYKLDINITEKLKYQDTDISASYIRRLIQSGDITLANQLLGHEFSISQKVIPGKKIGREIGIPTINQDIPENQLIPKLGVYATYVVIDKKMIPSVTNVGYRPTLDNKCTVNIETHLIDKKMDLYDKSIRVYYLKFIRSIKKFENSDKLVAQISLDIEKSRGFFINFKNNAKST